MISDRRVCKYPTARIEFVFTISSYSKRRIRYLQYRRIRCRLGLFVEKRAEISIRHRVYLRLKNKITFSNEESRSHRDAVAVLNCDLDFRQTDSELCWSNRRPTDEHTVDTVPCTCSAPLNSSRSSGPSCKCTTIDSSSVSTSRTNSNLFRGVLCPCSNSAEIEQKHVRSFDQLIDWLHYSPTKHKSHLVHNRWSPAVWNRTVAHYSSRTSCFPCWRRPHSAYPHRTKWSQSCTLCYVVHQKCTVFGVAEEEKRKK